MCVAFPSLLAFWFAVTYLLSIFPHIPSLLSIFPPSPSRTVNANLTHPSSSRLPLSAFYVTLIDSLGSTALIEDFTSWESGSGTEEDKLSLCQYPFLMSLGVKVGLLGWDGERQMVRFFSQVVLLHASLSVRR